jgi:hypothetical protein
MRGKIVMRQSNNISNGPPEAVVTGRRLAARQRGEYCGCGSHEMLCTPVKLVLAICVAYQRNYAMLLKGYIKNKMFWYSIETNGAVSTINFEVWRALAARRRRRQRAKMSKIN